MKRLYLSPREQWLSALVIIVVVLGTYTLLRFIPANRHIETLDKKAQKTHNKILKVRLPEQPYENIDQLTKESNQLKQEIALINDMSINLTQHLAPIDSQSLKLEISQLARDSEVFIQTNEKMKTANVIDNKLKKNKRKPLTNAIKTNLILPESAGWLARMSPGTLFHRPMQRIQLSGSFLAIRKFIHGLRNLSYQVTILKIKIEKSSNNTPAGYPQTLSSELVLAL